MTTFGDMIASILKLSLELKKAAAAGATNEAIAGLAAAGIATLNGNKNNLVGLYGCFDATPVGKIEAAFNCAGNALNLTDSLCSANADTPQTRPGCERGPDMARFCQTIADLKAHHAAAKIGLDYAKNAVENAILAAVCASIQAIDTLVSRLTNPSFNSRGNRNLNNPFEADLDALVAELSMLENGVGCHQSNFTMTMPSELAKRFR